MTKSLYDPEYWKERAAKARLRAEESLGESSYISLLQQALDYDRLAEAAAQHGPPLPLPPIAQPNAQVVSSEPPNPSIKARRPFLRLMWHHCMRLWPDAAKPFGRRRPVLLLTLGKNSSCDATSAAVSNAKTVAALKDPRSSEIC
jgi:hypothetical protein